MYDVSYGHSDQGGAGMQGDQRSDVHDWNMPRHRDTFRVRRIKFTSSVINRPKASLVLKAITHPDHEHTSSEDGNGAETDAQTEYEILSSLSCLSCIGSASRI